MRKVWRNLGWSLRHYERHNKVAQDEKWTRYTKVCQGCGEVFNPDDGRARQCASCRGTREAGTRYRGFRLYQAEHLPLLAALGEALDGWQDQGVPDDVKRDLTVLFALRERLRTWLLENTRRPD